jgi:signal transduction histidine kinase
MVIERHLRARGRTLSGELSWRKKDGTPMVVRLTARLVELEDERDGPTLQGIAEDITHKRALEEQLRQSQKMEAVGRLARGIAHDFNNVLAAILGCADLMQLRLKEGDELMVEAREIANAAERGASLTRQLLLFSRRQSVEPQVVDVHEVLRGFDTMLQRIAGEITLRLHTSGPSPKVRLEPGQLEQVVMNLVLNARDASTLDGAIDVKSDTATFEAANAPGLPPGRYARIAVRDYGAGIDPELQRLVFEPFFTTKDPARGNGLGLSIVYGIAREAGGTVTFTSLPGKGTTFEVFLPLVDG